MGEREDDAGGVWVRCVCMVLLRAAMREEVMGKGWLALGAVVRVS